MERQTNDIEGTSLEMSLADTMRIDIERKLELHDRQTAENKEMMSLIMDHFHSLEERVTYLEGTTKKQLDSIEKNFKLITTFTSKSHNFQRTNPAYESELRDNVDVQETSSKLQQRGW